jgi:lambda repressor-like predicted transcriptional regulator
MSRKPILRSATKPNTRLQALADATGLSRMQCSTLLKKRKRPTNRLVAAAWDKVMGEIK